jgi:Rhodanese-like domain
VAGDVSSRSSEFSTLSFELPMACALLKFWPEAGTAMALTLEPLSSREFVRHGDHATLDDVFAGEPRPLTLGDVLRAQRAGAQLLDTRSPAEFAAGHLEGSTHIALGEGFASWASTLGPSSSTAGPESCPPRRRVSWSSRDA